MDSRKTDAPARYFFTGAARLLALTLVVATASGHAVYAQDLDKGLAAAERGDYATALQEWRPLAEQGDAMAQYNLGWLYNNGEGVPQDDVEAVRWYRMSAEQGYASAQYNLGVMFDFGQGVPQDDVEAVNWYRMAAEQGDEMAQSNLGAMYANGEGVIQDNVYAHMWFNIAASLGHERGKENRGKIAKRMSPADISKAQELARECVRKGYKGC